MNTKHSTPNSARDAGSRCVLGTAQLGMSYGIANSTGRPDTQESCRLIESAWTNGVRCFDTAQAYGDSECALGEALAAGGWQRDARVITKIHPSLCSASSEEVCAGVLSSIRRLGVASLCGLLMHREDQMFLLDGVLGDTLRELRASGAVRHLGVSVYTPEKALEALDRPDIEMVQVPANVFDRRMARAGVLEKASSMGKRVFIRSVYLQGLVFLSPRNLPSRVAFASLALKTYNDFCLEHGLDSTLFALHYIRDRYPDTQLVMGAETADQVVENIRRLEAEGPPMGLLDAWDAQWPDDVSKLVDPSQWDMEEEG